MNLKIIEFEITLKNYINSVDLPQEVKRLAMKEIYEEISASADAAVSAELDEREAAESEAKQDEQGAPEH